MRLTEYLIMEARRNPTQNPRISTKQELENILKKHPNAFATFTKIDKFGANPQSPYPTPLGIYAYSISYLLNAPRSIYGMHNPFIQAFVPKPGSNILVLSKAHINETVRHKLIDAVRKLGYDAQPLLTVDSDAGLWRAVYAAVGHADYENEEAEGWNMSSLGVMIRKIFTSSGLDGIVDPGLEIIYADEPMQAVFFNTRCLKFLGSIRNGLLNNTSYSSTNHKPSHAQVDYDTIYDAEW